MNIEPFHWYSRRLGREMVLMRYGHWGPALLYFPTSGGGHTEFDYYRMQDDAAWFIENGFVQFFVLDGFARTSWYANHLHPRQRLEGHLAYEDYVIHEAVPFIQNLTKIPALGCMGASFGAYYALNTLCRFPHLFRVALCMGGVYDISSHLDGYFDQDAYFHNPVSYLPNLDDPWYRAQLGYSSMPVLYVGEADPFIQSTWDLHDLLRTKGIPHELHVWDAPCNHHEFWWKKQLPHFLSRHYNGG